MDPANLGQLEATLERLKPGFRDLPFGGVLLSRLLQHLGRGMSTLLDLQIRPFGLTEVEFRVPNMVFSQPARRRNRVLCITEPGRALVGRLVPAQNGLGNWIKVVQRVPVRMQIDDADLG